MNLDALVSAREAAIALGVERHAIYQWRIAGKISPQGRRGRSPLYRWGDLIRVERDTRRAAQSHRCVSR
jgi:predicted site-specific integrase-resolvase